MATDFERALGVLESQDGDISRELVASLSGATWSESKLFVALLDKVSPERRCELMLRLGSYADESFELDFADIFRQSLTHVDPNVRRCAIEGLWEDARPSLADALVRLLDHDPDASVRAAAASALGRFVFMSECDELDERRCAAVRASLERVIADGGEEIAVVRRAVEAIAFINDDEVRAIVGQAYASSDVQMRESAITAMGRSADPCWADMVLDELDADSLAIQLQAVRACGELQLKSAAEQIIQFAKGPDRELQTTAIWSLGQIGGRRSKQVLERWIESGDEKLSAAAEEALSELELGTASLDLMLYDPDQSDYVVHDLAEDQDEADLDPFDEDVSDEEDDDASEQDQEWPDEFLEIG